MKVQVREKIPKKLTPLMAMQWAERNGGFIDLITYEAVFYEDIPVEKVFNRTRKEPRCQP